MDALLVELLAELILRKTALGKDAIHVYVICISIRHWGNLRPKISLVSFCMKTHFWRLKSPKIYCLMTTNTKKCSKKAFFAFSSPMAVKILVCFHPLSMLYYGISTIWATPYVM